MNRPGQGALCRSRNFCSIVFFGEAPKSNYKVYNESLRLDGNELTRWPVQKVQKIQYGVAVAIIIVLTGLFLGPQSCKVPEPPEGIEGAKALLSWVPPEAEVVFLSEELGALVGLLTALDRRIPLVAGVGDHQAWSEGGAKWNAPAAAYLRGNELVLLGFRHPDKELDIGQIFPPEGVARRDWDPGVRRGQGWKDLTEEGAVHRWASSDGIHIALGILLGEEKKAPRERQSPWSKEKGRELSPEFEAFQREEGAPIYVAIRGDSLVKALPGRGHAVLLRNQLAESLGEVYVAIPKSDLRESIALRIYTPGGEAPSLGLELGEASAALPNLGGLARPGVLGMLRISATPSALLSLLRAVLPVEERRRLEEMLQALDQDLLVDVENSVLQNLTGQFALVFYGIEDQFFELHGLELVASLIRLQSTKEALLIPINDRRQMEDYLNIFTQLSRGRLRRQVIRHTVHYAWFEDGALEWAFILNDDYLLFVDSAVAFEHASSWERSPVQLTGSLAERNVDSLMSATRGIGAYLDLSTLRSILGESGRQGAGEWLREFDALGLETDIDGRRDLSEVTIWFRQQED